MNRVKNIKELTDKEIAFSRGADSFRDELLREIGPRSISHIELIQIIAKVDHTIKKQVWCEII
jgi:hypothetical protein